MTVGGFNDKLPELMKVTARLKAGERADVFHMSGCGGAHRDSFGGA